MVTKSFISRCCCYSAYKVAVGFHIASTVTAAFVGFQCLEKVTVRSFECTKFVGADDQTTTNYG